MTTVRLFVLVAKRLASCISDMGGNAVLEDHLALVGRDGFGVVLKTRSRVV